MSVNVIDSIETYLQQQLADSPLFLVYVSLTGQGGGYGKLMVLIDSDSGLTIDDCTKVSRDLSAWLDMTDLIREKYHLEVSSPGVSWPLTTRRQLAKNIDRDLKVVMADKQEHIGKLVAVHEDSFDLIAMVKPEKGKKLIPTPMTINLADTTKVTVQISFK